MADYTTVDKVAKMFPSFTRGITQQKPSDTIIGEWITDVTGEVNAILLRRFSEAINTVPYTGNFDAWVAALPAPAIAILEKVTRFGAAAQLGFVLATLGSKSAETLADWVQGKFEALRDALNGVNDKGEPLAAGLYDKYFDPLARVQSPRPGMAGIAGGDQQKGQVAADLGINMPFSLNEVI